MLAKFCRLFGGMKEEDDRNVLVSMAQKMAKRKAARAELIGRVRLAGTHSTNVILESWETQNQSLAAGPVVGIFKRRYNGFAGV
jgi:hypothetical protein